LKYVVIVLVAALVIGAVVAITTTFTQSATSGSQKINQTLSTGLTQSAKTTCQSMGCTWNAVAQNCTCS